MSDAVLEGQTIDQRLQRRSGRADGTGHVDMASTRLVKRIGRTDRGQDLARGVIGDQDGERDALAQGVGALGGQGFQAFLQAGVEGQALDTAFGMGAMQTPGQMGGEHRKGTAHARHRLAQGAGQLDRVDAAGGVETLEDGIAGTA